MIAIFPVCTGRPGRAFCAFGKALGLASGVPCREIVENRELESLAEPLRLPPHVLRVIQVGR